MVLQTIAQPLPNSPETPLCEYFCTVCHRPFVAHERRVERIHCPACQSTDYPALRKINTFAYSYYQMSEAGQQEMKRARQEWCFDDGQGVFLYDKSPLRADAVRIGLLNPSPENAKVMSADTHGQAVSALVQRCEADPTLHLIMLEINAILRYESTQPVAPGARLQERLAASITVQPVRRTAIISDIHGNYAGLISALEDIRRHDCERILCLGDLVEGGPDDEGVVRVLRESGIACVRGNHDENNDVALSPETRRFLAELPEFIAEQDVLYTHISPRNKKRKIDHVVEAWNVFEEACHRLIFVGHAHVPHVFGKSSRTYGEATRHPLEYNRPLQLDESDRYVISVGAIGYGRDTVAKIRYCIFDAEAGTVEMRAIEGPLLPLDYSVARIS